MGFCRNVNISIFWISRFYSQERRFFALEYRKRHCPGLYFLKKKSWKNGHGFGPKPWVNPFENMSIFPICEILVFIA